MFVEIDPEKESHLNNFVTPLPQACWDYLYKKFGGGPEVKALHICSVCAVCNWKLISVFCASDLNTTTRASCSKPAADL